MQLLVLLDGQWKLMYELVMVVMLLVIRTAAVKVSISSHLRFLFSFF